MALPQAKLEIAFGVAATAEPTAGQWIDVSDYLRAHEVNRGRQRELARIEAGTATFLLSNADRRFDPEHAAGPYYGKILPNVHVRLSEAGTGKALFRGFADTWTQSWPISKDATVTLTATDAFKVLANVSLAAADLYELWISKLGILEWWRLDEAAGATTIADSGSSAARTAIATGAPTLGLAALLADHAGGSASFSGTQRFTAPPTVDAVGAIFAAFKIGDTSGGAVWIYESENSRLDQIRRLGVDTSGRVVMEARTSVGALGQRSAAGVLVDDGLVHTVLAVFASGAPTLYVDGVVTSSVYVVTQEVPGNQVTIGNENGGANPFSGTLDELVTFDNADQTADDAAKLHAAAVGITGLTVDAAIGKLLDFAAWPTSLRDLEAVDNKILAPQLGGSLLEAIQKIIDTEEGLFYVNGSGKLVFRGRDYYSTTMNVSQMTFGDNTTPGIIGSECPYVDLVLEQSDFANDARTQREGSSTVFTVTDAASISQFFKRSIERTALLHQNDQEVLQHAEYLVAKLADPRQESRSCAVMLGDARVDRSKLLSLTFGDLITLVRRVKNDQGLQVGAEIRKTLRVEGLSHNAERDTSSWKVGLWFSAWDAATDQFLVWNDADDGVWGSDRWGF